jgi:hypothetical protein
MIQVLEGVGRDPARVLSVPFGVGTADELFEIRAQRGKVGITPSSGGRRVGNPGMLR